MATEKEELIIQANLEGTASEDLRELSLQLKRFADTAGRQLEDLTRSADKAEDQLGEVADSAKDADKKLDALADAANKADKTLDGIAQAANSADNRLEEIARTAESTDGKLAQLAGASQRVAMSLVGIGRGAATSLVAMGGSAVGALSLAAAYNLADASIRRVAEASDLMIQSSSLAEGTISKFATVFKEETMATARVLREFGEDVGRGQAGLMRYAAAMQDTLVPIGFARDAAAGLSTDLTQLAVDLASFNNLADEEALSSIQSALVGESEPMRKFGVILTETKVKAEAYATGIAKAGSELTEMQKVQARVSLMFKETSDAQGDAARTAEEFANLVKRLGSEVEDLRIKFGFQLQDEITAVIDRLGGADQAADLLAVALGFVAESATGLIRAGGHLAKIGLDIIDSWGGADRVLYMIGGQIDKISLDITKMLGLAREAKVAYDLLTGEKTVFQALGASAVINAEIQRAKDLYNARLSERAERAMTGEDRIEQMLRDLDQSQRERDAKLRDTRIPNYAADPQGRTSVLNPTGDPRAFGPRLPEEDRTFMGGVRSAVGDFRDTSFSAGMGFGIGAFNTTQRALEDFSNSLAEGNVELDKFAESLARGLQETLSKIGSTAITEKLFDGMFDTDVEKAQELTAAQGLEAAGGALSSSAGLLSTAGTALQTAAGAWLASASAGSITSATTSPTGPFNNLPFHAHGGPIPGYPSGGYVHPRDTVLGLLSPREYVLDPNDVNRLGVENLNHFRAGGDLKGAKGQPPINFQPRIEVHVSQAPTSDPREFQRRVADAVKQALRGADAELARMLRDR